MDLLDFRVNIIHLIGVNGVKGLKWHKKKLKLSKCLGLGWKGV